MTFTGSLTRFPLLASDEYTAGTFDFKADTEDGVPSLREWIEVFRNSLPGFQRAAENDESVDVAFRAARAAQFSSRYNGILDHILENPGAPVSGFEDAPLSCVRLCHIRDTCLRQEGFWDPYATIKARENSNALELLPGVLGELDSIPDSVARFEAAVKGVFAGNVFDLGAPKMVEQYENGVSASELFKQARSNLASRPWAVDTFDNLLQRMSPEAPPHKKAIVFADNAGSDIVLGMIPFMRELLKRGTTVVVAVNDVPSINDITLDEMKMVMESAATLDSVLRGCYKNGIWRVIGSGNDLPVIDLNKVSDEVSKEAQDADLVVLEGMGRGIETNLYAKFRVESLKLGMIKHEEVAMCLNGRLYDCVCQYYPACA